MKPAALLAALALAGCLAPAAAPDDADRALAAVLEVPSVDMGHDHADPALHPERAEGFRVLGSVRIAEGGPSRSTMLEGGQLGMRIFPAGDLLFVSLVRDDQRAGFAVVDVAEPGVPKLVGTYKSDYGASEGEGLAVLPDASLAFVAIETGYSDPAVPPAVEVVDVSDPAAPRLLRRVPVAAQPHVLHAFEADGARWLLASDYHYTILAAGLLPQSSAVSDGVTVFRVEADGALLPVARVQGDATQRAIFFAHDPVVVEHPADGRRLLYLGAFGGGGRVYDLADPAQPRFVGAATDAGSAPVVRHHSFLPAPALVDDALPTAAVPRSRADDGAAFLTIYDTADPAAPTILGEWRHPDTTLVPGDDPPLNLHAPTFAQGGARLLVPHFHAGLFAFDVSSRAAIADLQPVAHWTPPAGEVVDGVPFVSAAVTAVEVGGVVYATEGVSGTLWALALER